MWGVRGSQMGSQPVVSRSVQGHLSDTPGAIYEQKSTKKGEIINSISYMCILEYSCSITSKSQPWPWPWSDGVESGCPSPGGIDQACRGGRGWVWNTICPKHQGSCHHLNIDVGVRGSQMGSRPVVSRSVQGHLSETAGAMS